MRLDGKNVFITGGSRGIGKSICIALAKEGANVAFLYLEQTDMANEVVEEIEKHGRKALSFKCDVRDRTGLKNLFQKFESDWGSIDILINNAGINKPTDFDQITEDEWDEVISVNLKGPFIVTQEALPLLRKIRLLASSI